MTLPRSTHRIATVCLAFALAMPSLLAGCGRAARNAPPTAPNPTLGSTVALALPSTEGDLVELPQSGAKVTVIDAFSPTCEPCAKKVPALVAQRDELAELGAKLVLVAVLSDDESDEAAAAALSSWGVSSAFLVDRGEVLRRSLGVETLPATMVLDATGKVRWAAPSDADANAIVAAAEAAGR